MRGRKGITLEMVAGVTLAVIGVSILIAMSSEIVGGPFNDLYCSSYQGVSFLLSGGSEAPPPPKQCRPQVEECETKVLEIEDKSKVSLRIISSILGCWNRYKGYGNVSRCCGGFNIKDMEGDIGEVEITSIMEEKGFCPDDIENSEIEEGPGEGCGDKNNIRFEYEKIKKGDYVILRYINESVVVR